MKQYHGLLAKLLAYGEERPDRTGTGTLSLFGERLEFNLADGFPLVTTKKIHFKSVVAELIWMLSGSTNVKDLQAMGCTIWDEWADEIGELGRVYGAQWRDQRSWERGIDGNLYQRRPKHLPYRQGDQIQALIHTLWTDPFSRRHVVSAWNASDLPFQALAPCHMSFQFYVSKDQKLSCHMYQRSCDAFLGLPFNIASYALLTHLFCQTHGFEPGRLIISFGDVHLYKNHLDQARLQLGRIPVKLPTIRINPHLTSVLDVKPEDIELLEYYPYRPIKGDVSV